MIAKQKWLGVVLVSVIIAINISIKFLILYTHPFFFNAEICRRRTLAKEIIERKNFIFIKQIHQINRGGGSLVSFLAIPFYLLFNDSPLNFHFVGILFSTLTLIGVYFFLQKFFNKKAALLGSLLFVFSPLTYTVYSLSAWGDHATLVFFQVLATFIFFEILTSRKPNRRYFILLGIISAIGIWIFIAFLSTVIFILFFWFITGKNLSFRKNFIFFLVPFLSLLVLSWIWNISIDPYYRGGLPELLAHEHLGVRFNIITFLEKVKNTFIYYLPDSFYFDNSFKFSYLYYSIFLFSLLFLLIEKRKCLKNLLFKAVLSSSKRVKIDKELFFPLFFIFYVLLFSFSQFPIYKGNILHSHRYLMPLYFPMITITSISLVRIYDVGTRYKIVPRLLTLFLTFLLLFISIKSNLNLISLDSFGPPQLIYREYCYDSLTLRMEPKECERLKDEFKYYCYENRGHQLMIYSRNFTFVREECEKLKDEKKEWCLQGAAKGAGFLGYSYDFTVAPDGPNIYVWEDKDWIHLPLKEEIRNYKLTPNPNPCGEVDMKYKIFCYEAFPVPLLYINKFYTKIDIVQVCENLNETYEFWCKIGLNRRIFFDSLFSLQRKFSCNTKYCLLGAGKEIGYRYQKVSHAFELCNFYFNAKGRNYCYKGIGAMLGERFRYNLTLAYMYCHGLENGGRKYCEDGVKNLLKDEL